MKDYLSYTPEEFACDEDFLKWVKYPEQYPSLGRFWSQWLAENPQKREDAERAQQLILAVATENKHLPGAVRQHEIWEEINETIRRDSSGSRTLRLWRHKYSIAAAVLIVTGLSFYGWEFGKRLSSSHETNGVDLSHLETHVNNSNLPKTIILSDETSIVLQPSGVLEYPVAFDDDKREVYLTGEAFFEVKKDVQRPFLVHANEIVTRVLGTSFSVRNYREEKNVVVQVKTGRVSVFRENSARPSKIRSESVEGVVLMPNQQVVYEREEMKMVKSLVENPSVLTPVAKQEFEFTDTPIKDVFSAIEQAYGVEIVFDEEALSSCYLNASLVDIPLYDKLRLICKAINTTYEVMDSHIIIYGSGCNEN